MGIKIPLKKYHLSSKIKKAKVAIIVPFRDQIKQRRKKQLKIFSEYMNKFMKKYDNWKIFIIKQSFDNKKFNRGKLLNIGFKLAYDEGHNTFIFHDVDLLPEKSVYKLYTTYPENPIHFRFCCDQVAMSCLQDVAAQGPGPEETGPKYCGPNSSA